MTDFLLRVMPGMMAQYEYAHDLLKWAEQGVAAIKAHHAKSTIGYPEMEPLLLSSLERVSHDLRSVPLLQFVIKLKKLNERIEKTNANRENDAAVIDTFFGLEEDIPGLDAELKKTLAAYATKAIVFFVVLVLLIVVPLIALIRCV